jgi:hypothetical protein
MMVMVVLSASILLVLLVIVGVFSLRRDYLKLLLRLPQDVFIIAYMIRIAPAKFILK